MEDEDVRSQCVECLQSLGRFSDQLLNLRAVSRTGACYASEANVLIFRIHDRLLASSRLVARKGKSIHMLRLRNHPRLITGELSPRSLSNSAIREPV